MRQIFCGTSGWAYPTWKPEFYPATVRSKDFLSYYASQLTSVEVNYTFRSLPRPQQLADWLAATPEGFRFSFKAPQRITHFSRLRACEPFVSEFLAALAPAIDQGKLGALLFQLPPNFKADHERLAEFLRLPELQGPHAPKLAFEFRHESWFTEQSYALLREQNVALCIAETEDLSTPEIHTASHRYFRFRQPGGYSPAQITQLAQRLTATPGSTFAYFMHEDEPTGALNAQTLLQEIA
ncbi:MAG: DUF72 domain-containing protein [Acidobacteriaceae bacterium]|nr:DUF72 domain-containing protein [Acidobacteriaceae bacterium]